MSQSFFLTENQEDQKKYKDAYMGYVVEFATAMNDFLPGGASTESIKNMAEKIYEFERQIAINMWSQTEMRDPVQGQKKYIY